MSRVHSIFRFYTKIAFFIILSSSLQGQEIPGQTISVGVYDNPPKIFFDEAGKPAGFFIDILESIAAEEDLTVEYVSGTWHELTQMLGNGEIDVLPDMAYSEKRDSIFAFNKLFLLSSWFDVYTKNGSGIKSVLDLNNMRIGVLKGSVQEDYLKTELEHDFGIDIILRSFDSYELKVKALEENDIDAFLAGRFFYFSDLCNESILPTGIVLHPDELFFAFPKHGSTELILVFDQHISELKNDSKSIYYSSLQHWFDKEYNSPFPVFLVWLIVGIAILSAVSFVFVFLLRKEVARKTRELKLSNGHLIEAKEKAELSDRLKTEFLNNISHEIRTPMNGIIGFTKMLESKGITDDQQARYTGIIRESSRRLLKIIDNILEISSLETRQEVVHEEAFSLNDLLEELFTLFKLVSREKGLRLGLRKELPDKQSFIKTDKIRLYKILSNLLENATRYTHEGVIELGYTIEDSTLVLYVKDTGVGVSDRNKELIFKRFSQEEKDLSRKEGGLGLGLSISQENARLLGGDITLESEKGVGSTFYVHLPYVPVDKKQTASLKDLSGSGLPENAHTILVAEDEEINFIYIKALIEQENQNYRLLHARNGEEALKMIQEVDDIDIVLMDIKMPILDGYETTREIKSKLPLLPVIAQTAYHTESDKKKAFDHGCDGFISKPIDKDELFDLIQKFIRRN